jgi:hypothetical protein
MSVRGGGCFTPAALLLAGGLLLIFYGEMADKPNPVKYGIGCLIGATVFLGAALYVRWQEWE